MAPTVSALDPFAHAHADDSELMQQHRDGDRQARAAMIERYIPLARSLALRYRRTAEPLDDLVQVASLGLVKAVDRWEPERGLRFSTFAVPTILGELRRYFRDATWVVRPPRDLLELALTIERTRERLNTAIGREPAAADFAEHLGRAPETVAQALHAGSCRVVSSLDTEVLDDSSHPATVGDLIGADDAEFERAEARVAFGHMTSDLDSRARTVLQLRFDDDLLQTDIAERIGCSQIHVSRIIRSSLETIRDDQPA
jgi:RNA polymerase sigma-B factor